MIRIPITITQSIVGTVALAWSIIGLVGCAHQAHPTASVPTIGPITSMEIVVADPLTPPPADIFDSLPSKFAIAGGVNEEVLDVEPAENFYPRPDEGDLDRLLELQARVRLLEQRIN